MIKGAGEMEYLRGKKRIAEERSRMQRVVGAGGGRYHAIKANTYKKMIKHLKEQRSLKHCRSKFKEKKRKNTK